MTQRASAEIPETTKSNQRLAILLAMAMFVLAGIDRFKPDVMLLRFAAETLA